jgi:hypothetical protein
MRLASRATDRLNLSLIDAAGAYTAMSAHGILFGAGATLYGPIRNGIFRL